jgi:hypothetical protein
VTTSDMQGLGRAQAAGRGPRVGGPRRSTMSTGSSISQRCCEATPKFLAVPLPLARTCKSHPDWISGSSETAAGVHAGAQVFPCHIVATEEDQSASNLGEAVTSGWQGLLGRRPQPVTQPKAVTQLLRREHRSFSGSSALSLWFVSPAYALCGYLLATLASWLTP